MKPIYEPRHYSNAETYAAEEEKLFRGLWQFAATADQLANENDFVTREIGGKAIFLQRLNGVVRAFENVCSHRFARLHSAPCGNAKIRCAYHGWQYDGNGVPCTIPHRPRFDDLTPATLQQFRLPSWSVEQCGSLYFVRQGEGPSLQAYLGGVFNDLALMSSSFGPKIDTNEMVIAANWKIVVENTLEGYHVDFVHENTFKRLGAKTGADTWRWDLPHSRYYSPLSDKFEADCRKVQSLFSSRPFQVGGYLHQLIFPNLTLATTFGTSFSLQHIEPLGPHRTRFTSHVFQTRVTDEFTGSKRVMVDAINESVKQFNREVFNEDQSVCEAVHQGAMQTTYPGLLSDEEFRVAEFQRTWRIALERPDELLSMKCQYPECVLSEAA